MAYRKQKFSQKLVARLTDLLFAGPAPLDRESQARVDRSDAEVNAVFVPIDL